MVKQDNLKKTPATRRKKRELRNLDWAASIAEYNSFCKNLHEGDILYNLDVTNLWGEYLLVAAKTKFVVNGIPVFFMLLLGLDNEDGEFKPNNLRISLSPEKLENIRYLKFVGNCKFGIQPIIEKTGLNEALNTMYKKMDLKKYSSNLGLSKPRRRKYDASGELRIKSTLDN